jgi:hypothetical protein
MKILNRKQLMAMPAGTVFSYYEPINFNGLYIKSSEPDNNPDFFVQDLIGAVENNSSDDFFTKCEQMEEGASLPVDFEISGREGLFDDKLRYAIYEKEDVEKLIKILEER